MDVFPPADGRRPGSVLHDRPHSAVPEGQLAAPTLRRAATRAAVSVSPRNSSVVSSISSLAGDVEATVEPGDEHLADPADEHGGGQGADALAVSRRPAAGRGVGLDERRDVVAGADPSPVERLVAERLDVQDTGPPAVVVDEADGGADGGPHLGRPIRRGVIHATETARPQLVDDPLVHGHDQLVEVTEALVEVARVEAGVLADGAHRGAGGALGPEQLEAGVEEETAPLGPPVVGGDAGPSAPTRLISGSWQGRSPYPMVEIWQRSLPQPGLAAGVR